MKTLAQQTDGTSCLSDLCHYRFNSIPKLFISSIQACLPDMMTVFHRFFSKHTKRTYPIREGQRYGSRLLHPTTRTIHSLSSHEERSSGTDSRDEMGRQGTVCPYRLRLTQLRWANRKPFGIRCSVFLLSWSHTSLSRHRMVFLYIDNCWYQRSALSEGIARANKFIMDACDLNRGEAQV